MNDDEYPTEKCLEHLRRCFKYVNWVNNPVSFKWAFHLKCNTIFKTEDHAILCWIKAYYSQRNSLKSKEDVDCNPKVSNANRLKDVPLKSISTCISKLIGLQNASVKEREEMIIAYSFADILHSFPDVQHPRFLNKYHYKMLMQTHNIKKANETPVKATSSYEFGWQTSDLCANGKMAYMKFYNICMVDYDSKDLKSLLLKLEPYSDTMSFSIYETYAGYHVYVTSHYIDHRNAFHFMIVLGCDIWYAQFCLRYGFNIRLSKKLNRDEQFVERWVANYGYATPISKILKLIKLKNRLTQNIQGVM